MRFHGVKKLILIAIIFFCGVLALANAVAEAQQLPTALDVFPECPGALIQPVPMPAPNTALNIKLVNTYVGGDIVTAYLIGKDKQNNFIILNADGSTWYYPGSSGPCYDVKKTCRCAINSEAIGIPVPQGPTGTTIRIDRYIHSARIYFAAGGEDLQFFLNLNGPKPQLVEPSVINDHDAKYYVDWGFAELAWDEDNMNADITFIDFVGSPIGLELSTPGLATQYAKGTPPDAVACMCKKLQAQTGLDQVAWDTLCTKGRDNLNLLRAINPEHSTHPSFKTYWDDYVNQVWDFYKYNILTITSYANWTGRVQEVNGQDMLVFDASPETHNTPGSFIKPTSAAIFLCDTGTFQVAPDAPDARMRTIPILCAAFNRGTLLLPGKGAAQPDGVTDVADYYSAPTCNHFSRMVHEAEIDTLGYAFPYDEIKPHSGGVNQQGKVEVSSALVGSSLLTITVGGMGEAPVC